MSDSTGPVRRRRIAGESKPAAPATKAAVAKKTPAKKTPATKAAVAKKTPAKKTPAKKAPATKAAVAKKTPTKKTPIAPAAPAARKAPAPSKARVVQKSSAVEAPPAVAASVATPSRKPAVAKPVVAPRPSGTATADRAVRPRPSKRDLLLVVPLALVALATVIVGTFLVVDNSSSDGSSGDLATANRQASSAAASAAETIFSFRYDQLPQHLEASKALMTPSFAKDFEKIAPALTELAPERKIQVQAVTREAAPLPCGDECSDTKASILVFIDQARLVGSSQEPTVFANRIKVSMVKQDGGWLVNQIDAL